MIKFDEGTNAYIDDSNSRIRVEIGDAKQGDFLPRVKLCAWDNECNISFGLDLSSKETEGSSKNEGKKAPSVPTVEVEDDTVKWKDGNTEAHFYPLEVFEGGEDGGFEFEVILNEKPESNVINLTIKEGYWQSTQPPNGAAYFFSEQEVT